jgi:hypothetical protein
MEKTKGLLKTKEDFDKSVNELFEDAISKRLKSFSEQINKLETIE